MGNVVKDVASGISNVSKEIATPISRMTGSDQIGRMWGDIIGGNITGTGPLGGSAARVVEQALTPTKAPAALTPDQGLTGIQTAQQQQYQDYLTNLPKMQKQMQEQYTQQAHKQIAAGQKAGESKMASRGLGYGGLNEAMKQQVAAQGKQDLAGQLANVNQGLLSMGNQIQQGGIQTGVGMQNQMQALQNMLYQQQLARQNAENSTTGSILGLIGGAGIAAI